MKVVLLTILATFFIQVGYFLWKVAAATLPRIGKDHFVIVVKGFISNGKWLLGLLATMVGWMLFIRATEIGAISLVQPLMSIGDIFLVLLALIFLKERLIKPEWFGLFLTIAGATALSFDAEISGAVAINWTGCLILFLAALITLFFLLFIAKRSQRPEVILALAVGLCFGAGAVITKLITTNLVLNEIQLSLTSFLLTPLFPLMLAANVLGLILLQTAFQKGRASIVIPVQLSIVNGFAVFAGTVVFSETVSLYRLICIILIVVGTVFLQHSESGPDHS